MLKINHSYYSSPNSSTSQLDPANETIEKAESISKELSRWSYPFLSTNEKMSIVTRATNLIIKLKELLNNLLSNSNSSNKNDLINHQHQKKIVNLAKSLKSLQEKVNSFTGLDSEIAALNKKIKSLENQIASETDNIVIEISNLKNRIQGIEINTIQSTGNRNEELKNLKDRLNKLENLNLNLQSSKSQLINLNKQKIPIKLAQNIIKETEKKTDLAKRINDLNNWAENNHNNTLRNLPGVNLFFWTDEQAQKEAARLEIELLSDQAKSVASNPEKYKSALNNLKTAYDNYIEFLPPNSAEHSLAIAKLEKIDSDLNGLGKESIKNQLIQNIKTEENKMRSQLNKNTVIYKTSLENVWEAYNYLLDLTQDPRSKQDINQKIADLSNEYARLSNHR